MKSLFNTIENNLTASFNKGKFLVIAAYDSCGTELFEEWLIPRIDKYLLYYVSENKEWLGLVTDKKMFIHWLNEEMEEEMKKGNLCFNFKGLIFQERKQSTKRNFYQPTEKEIIEKIQVACGLIEIIDKPLTPYQFIKKHVTQDYADIYKMFAQLAKKQMLSGIFENGILKICSDNGKYSFPLVNLSNTCADDDIIKLFCDLFEPELLQNNPILQHLMAA